MTITSGAESDGLFVTSYFFRHWYKQTPYHSEPLPYKLVRANRFNTAFTGGSGESWSHTYGLNSCPYVLSAQGFFANEASFGVLPIDEVVNAAYAKFSSSVRGDVSEVAVNFAERKEAFSMMASRLNQIYQAAQAVRHLDPIRFCQVLGLKKPTRAERERWQRLGQWGEAWRHPKMWGNLWLEYHFGWSPLLGDIHAAIEICDGSYPWYSVIESSGFKLDSLTHPGEGVAWDVSSDDFRGMLFCKMASEISISDMTLLKANQLGLNNPASIAWELVPFSFVADWFGTIGLWINSFTDFSGLSLNRTQFVLFMKGEGHRYLEWGGSSLQFDYKVAAMHRYVGFIPGPTIALKPFRGFSISRGFTAISLILGIFAP